MEISAEVQKVIKCTIQNTIYNTVFLLQVEVVMTCW